MKHQAGRIRGIRVGIHWSLLVIFGLVVAGLAGSQLPHSAPGYPTAFYWLAALAAAAAFISACSPTSWPTRSWLDAAHRGRRHCVMAARWREQAER